MPRTESLAVVTTSTGRPHYLAIASALSLAAPFAGFLVARRTERGAAARLVEIALALSVATNALLLAVIIL